MLREGEQRIEDYAQDHWVSFEGDWGVVDCDRWVAVELAGPGGKEGNGGLFGCDGQFVSQGQVLDWGGGV